MPLHFEGEAEQVLHIGFLYTQGIYNLTRFIYHISKDGGNAKIVVNNNAEYVGQLLLLFGFQAALTETFTSSFQSDNFHSFQTLQTMNSLGHFTLH